MSFQRLALATIVAVYALILVGATVRASGSGMGCPDWPKCFGRWIPPTEESQLPADYQRLYAEHGYGEARFNAAKTWTEYLNRVLGVAIGLMILATFWRSLRFWPQRRGVVLMTAAAAVLVAFQGWLGSVVVDTNLHEAVVTAHMFVALVIVALLIAARERASDREPWPLVSGSGLFLALGLAAFTSLAQILVGTQVREAVDVATAAGWPRSHWLRSAEDLLHRHQLLAAAVIAVHVFLFWAVRRALPPRPDAVRLAAALLGLVLLQGITGALLTYGGFPAFAQPVHLLLAMVIAGLQVLFMVRYRRTREGQGLVAVA